MITCGGHSIEGITHTYAEQPAGSLVALVGSAGCLELAIAQGNAASRLGLAPRAEVRLDW